MPGMEVSHFYDDITSQGERLAELTYCKCEFLLYLSSILAQKHLHIIASTMPKRWFAAGCDDKGSDHNRRVLSA